MVNWWVVNTGCKLLQQSWLHTRYRPNNNSNSWNHRRRGSTQSSVVTCGWQVSGWKIQNSWNSLVRVECGPSEKELLLPTCPSGSSSLVSILLATWCLELVSSSSFLRSPSEVGVARQRRFAAGGDTLAGGMWVRLSLSAKPALPFLSLLWESCNSEGIETSLCAGM